jgi:hypothetical protein
MKLAVTPKRPLQLPKKLLKVKLQLLKQKLQKNNFTWDFKSPSVKRGAFSRHSSMNPPDW